MNEDGEYRRRMGQWHAIFAVIAGMVGYCIIVVQFPFQIFLVVIGQRVEPVVNKYGAVLVSVHGGLATLNTVSGYQFRELAKRKAPRCYAVFIGRRCFSRPTMFRDIWTGARPTVVP